MDQLAEKLVQTFKEGFINLNSAIAVNSMVKPKING
jgi:hypothetical protein